MKLRLHRDSLRLRLTPADVEQLLQTGAVNHSVPFAAGVEFLYSLQTRAETASIRATLEAPGTRLCVELPQSLAADWAAGDAVALNAAQDVGAGRKLHISIEKDFECLHPPGGPPQIETAFPNPNKKLP